MKSISFKLNETLANIFCAYLEQRFEMKIASEAV